MVGTAALLALLVSSLAAAGISAGVSAANNAKNIESQKEANEQNIAFQREINAQNQYNIENAHQIEMADLQAAGLNPVLTVTGGNGAAIQRLDAPQTKAVQSDASGITSALAGIGQTLQSLMMFSLMSDMRKEISQSHNDTLLAMSGNRDAVLSGLYRRKAEVMASTNSAATISHKTSKIDKSWKKEWNKIIKGLDNY